MASISSEELKRKRAERFGVVEAPAALDSGKKQSRSDRFGEALAAKPATEIAEVTQPKKLKKTKAEVVKMQPKETTNKATEAKAMNVRVEAAKKPAVLQLAVDPATLLKRQARFGNVDASQINVKLSKRGPKGKATDGNVVSRG